MASTPDNAARVPPHEIAATALLMIAGALLYSDVGDWTIIALMAFIAVAGILWPVSATLSTMAALPLVQAPVHLFDSIEVSLLEIGIVISSIAVGLRFAIWSISRNTDDIRQVLAPYAPLGFAAALVIVAALAMAYSPVAGHERESLRTFRWVILEPVALYVVCRYVIATRGRMVLGIALVLPAIVVSTVAVSEVVRGSGSFLANDVVRSTVAYRHPNNLALYLERLLMVSAAFAVLGSGRIRALGMIGSAFLGAGLLATFSRGAVLALFAGIAVLSWYQGKWRLILAYIGAVGALAAVAIVAFRERLTGDDTSGFVQTRLELWRDSLAMLRDYPVSGIGLDQFLYARVPRYIQASGWEERYTSHPHNVVLDSWLSLGFGGLVMLMVALAASLALARNIGDSNSNDSTLQIGCVAALGTGLAHGLVDNGYFLVDLSALTWILFAILVPDMTAHMRQSNHTEAE